MNTMVICSCCGGSKCKSAWFCPHCGQPYRDRIAWDIFIISLFVSMIVVCIGLIISIPFIILASGLR